MNAAAEETRLEHPCLEAGGQALDEVRLSDGKRLSLLLQGAALLAHLVPLGWCLPAGFRGARVVSEGLLCGVRIARGRSRRPAQEELVELLGLAFGGDEVLGRGPARRAARALAQRWRQPLAPLAADDAVAHVLVEAPFLWQPTYGSGRGALVGLHWHGERQQPWVAGPGRWRQRLLGAAGSLTELRRLVSSPEAASLWAEVQVELGVPSEEVGGPRVARDAERASAESASESLDRASRLAVARASFDRGQFRGALARLTGEDGPAVDLLRVQCQAQLGELGAARRTLRRLEGEELSREQTLVAVEAALRALANSGDLAALSRWVGRARQGARGRPRLAAELLAAEASWDRQDDAALARHLEAAAPAEHEPTLAWRWHRAQSLRAWRASDGAAMAHHLNRALAIERPCLRPFEAGRLWNDLALARILSGDLHGAEKACAHAARLLGRCEGPSATTLALFNLAEVRLRRGRLLGVEEILEASTAENRRAGNIRGLTHDLELWARYELVRGRPAVALAHWRAATADLDRRGLDFRRGELAVLAARALGWLGRAGEAATLLAATDAAARSELEPEELPALWALAGRPDEALAAAGDGPLAALWRSVLNGERPAPELWEPVAALGPYRSARLVLDLELLVPGAAPAELRHAAEAVFRRLGAESLAERLRADAAGPWGAIERYLAGSSGDLPAFARLCAEAGCPDLRLTHLSAGGEQVWLAGAGGPEELSAPVGEGELRLAAPRIDPVVKVVFALAMRDLGTLRPALPPTATEAGEPGADSLLGESPAMHAARERLALLAAGELPLLLLGESGTGKELAAKEAHRASPRRHGQILPVNCAALSETLLLSDLFGHVRGAFTGADRDRAGVFEAARGGTVFLDEIGDLPPVAQGNLLRVLQEREIRRLGESLPRRVDVRVIAATHRDLARMVEDGSFRRDLYFRLRVGILRLPPLRERGADVLLLAEHFLARPGGERSPRLTPAARRALVAHAWPGNVRELENVLAVAATLAGGGAIEPRHLDLGSRGEESSRSGGYHEQMESFRRGLVVEALAAAGGNLAEAARRLGLTRQALSYLVRQLGLRKK